MEEKTEGRRVTKTFSLDPKTVERLEAMAASLDPPMTVSRLVDHLVLMGTFAQKAKTGIFWEG